LHFESEYVTQNVTYQYEVCLRFRSVPDPQSVKYRETYGDSEHWKPGELDTQIKIKND